MNPRFLVHKDPYLHPDSNSLRAWMWAMLNQKSEYGCQLIFFLSPPGGGRWWRFKFDNDSWLSFELSFCIPYPGLSAFLSDELWQQYSEAYGLLKDDLERVRNPIPF